eukprot:Ihof_evm2s597 gene=Ihof_evmTU2s597
MIFTISNKLSERVGPRLYTLQGIPLAVTLGIRKYAAVAEQTVAAITPKENDWFTIVEDVNKINNAPKKEEPPFQRPDYAFVPLANNTGYLFWHPENALLANSTDGVTVWRMPNIEEELRTLSEETKTFIREVRMNDPDNFTLNILAQKFKVSSDTVARIARLPKFQVDIQRMKHMRREAEPHSKRGSRFRRKR